ncbi:uncharacterized protein LOC122464486 isoform X2 [Chelonia mydas]|uniref:uncharacterized protein LOC122464486 isoform X2 n=1 Tax=Chelonia mydas TaxID=8469 RepID=UPI001CA9E241|nr:uncharacterized protein LOC122464486 isoform X2 [Chelonia mydas]
MPRKHRSKLRVPLALQPSTPFFPGSEAPGGQIKQVPRPRLAVEEPEAVMEDSERNADNQLPSAEEEAEPGPSKRPTTKRKVAVPPGDGGESCTRPGDSAQEEFHPYSALQPTAALVKF